ncbi:LysM peptidoglycan-binding domain-containing protein, partial [Oscillibacter sp. CU971]
APTVAEGDYVVKSGDCLWSIAQEAYGTGRQWQVIYNANKDAIKNPNDLRVGQVLVIPAA